MNLLYNWFYRAANGQRLLDNALFYCPIKHRRGPRRLVLRYDRYSIYA